MSIEKHRYMFKGCCSKIHFSLIGVKTHFDYGYCGKEQSEDGIGSINSEKKLLSSHFSLCYLISFVYSSRQNKIYMRVNNFYLDFITGILMYHLLRLARHLEHHSSIPDSTENKIDTLKKMTYLGFFCLLHDVNNRIGICRVRFHISIACVEELKLAKIITK